MTDFISDIPQSLAHGAHQGTSFQPERRAEQERREYAQTLSGDWEEFAKHADTPEKLALLETEFARYREGFKRHTTKYLASRSRLVSSMIAGPSNFPAQRMNKRAETSHKRLEEMLAFREKARAAILRKLCPGARPIMAGDADAADRLREKIARAEAAQQQMKAANSAIRRNAGEGEAAHLNALVALGFRSEVAAEILKPDFAGRVGFASYQLTNNGANIRRMRERLAQIEKAAQQQTETIEGAHATLEDCPSENRVRLTFPGKPDEQTRAALKSRGFRWAPSLGVWQAYRNARSLETAREIAGVE